ncbi:hypothetical protein [Mucilaginibacter lacusdianchii]|uniref:hypothetical protein n=1 Tax=Mucilaginibacter lacusdianchii TaxID=2684211 RepID=UPI00131AB8F1|nr:hypothetical protein [Mucilaginibacter sp. JXJ CY 39]
MKRLIILTLMLLAAAVTITVAYFKKLSPPGAHTNQIISTIPNTAALIFEFDNDDSFYDIYDSSSLFSSVIGEQQLQGLNTLQNAFLRNPVLKAAFYDQNIYVSIHPQAEGVPALLFTLPVKNAVTTETVTALHDTAITIKAIDLAGKPGYCIHLNKQNQDFYLTTKGRNVFTGSFSKLLLEQAAAYEPKQTSSTFKLLPAQQSANSLGNLYINNLAFTPLFDALFKQHNPDFLKPLRILPATAALTLNYKSDALMFNGYTNFNAHGAVSYLNLFSAFKPVNNHLKNIFPLTTAYSNNFAVDDINKFIYKLADWQRKAGLSTERSSLFKKIKQETGIQIDNEFNKQLGHEFAILTTRFDEKLVIVELKDGSALRPFLTNISTMTDDESGQLNYDRIPYYLLGDVFNAVKRPHFIILDNYLILANTKREISNYKDNYLNARFLSHSTVFNEFNNLLSQQCNVAFYVNFKNSAFIFKRHLKPQTYQLYQQQSGLNNFYGASYQLSASDNEFYTNFCMKLDTASSAGTK